MGLPNILGSALKGAAKSNPLGGMLFGAMGAVSGGSPGTHKRRHRRKKLSNADIMELNHIKNILGKTAAANALPFYLGRR